MEVDLAIIFGTVWQSVADFLDKSFLFASIKFFIFVYCGVLLVNIILLMTMHGLKADFKKIIYGTDARPLMPRNTVIKRWEDILSRLETKNPSQYKVALLEADAFVDELLLQMGYKGESMTDKLESILGRQLETKEELIEAHGVRNRIVHEEDFVLTREETEKHLENYKKFLDELELF